MKKCLVVLCVALLAATVQAVTAGDIVVVSSSGDVAIRSGVDGSAVALASGHGVIDAVASGPNGDIVIGNGSGIKLLDGTTLAVKSTWMPGYQVTAVDFLSNGDVVAATANGMVSVRSGLDLMVEESGWSPGYSFLSLTVQSDDDILIGATGGDVFLRDSSLGFKQTAAFGGSDILCMGVLSNDDIVAGSLDGSVRVRDGSDITYNKAWWGGPAPVLGLGIQSDDDIALGLDFYSIYLRDAALNYKTDWGGSWDFSTVGSNDNIVACTKTGTLSIRNADLGWIFDSVELPFDTVTAITTQVPEPATIVLLGVGLAGILRKKK